MTEEVKKAFEEWTQDTSGIEEAKRYDFIGSKLLLRLFFYDPPKKEKSLIIGGEATQSILGSAADNIKGKEISAKFQIFPIAKVLAVGKSVTGEFENLKPGDLVTVMDDIKGTHLNPAWIDFMQEGGKDRRPKITSVEPPQFIGNISQWKRDIFMLDKFKERPDIDDAFTFLLPQTFVLSKYKNDE